jgi:tetratricopeptide (TPR) repeat protein
LTYFLPDSRVARTVDQLLDLLLLATLLAAPLVFYTKGYDVFEFNKITVMRVLSSLAAVSLLFKLLFVRPLPVTRSPLDLPVLAWLGVCVVCTFKTVSWRLSVHGVYEDFEGITTWVMYIFLFWWPLQHVRTERQIRLVLGTVVLAGTVAGFYGLLQNFGIDFVPWNPDTYNPDRMFSTMGNPNFLAAYTVMSMPITFVIFLDLPERIRNDSRLAVVLVLLGLIASVGLCMLFNTSYFDLDPSHFGADGFLGMLASQKFITTKVLLAFPLICALLLTWGRLRWILLLSLLGQVISTLYTKSRGGVFSMAALALIFGGAMMWEVFRWRGLLSMLGAVALAAGILASPYWDGLYSLAFTDQRLIFFVLFLGALIGLGMVAKRSQRSGVLLRNNNLEYLGALLVIIWMAHWVPAIRATTFEMLERTSKLFHPAEVRVTPRLFIWHSALAMLKDNPLFGKGLDTFQISFPPYREALYWILEWNGTPEKAHNFVMQTAATMGLMGLICFAWMHVTWIYSSFRDWRRQLDDRRRWLLLAGFGAWLGFFVQNLFSFTVVGYGSLWWILWGFVPAMQRTWEDSSAPPTGAPVAPVLAPAEAVADPVNVPAPALASAWSWTSPVPAWSVGLAVFSLALLTCVLAGPALIFGSEGWVPRLVLAVSGALALLWLVSRRERGAPALAEWVLLATCALGAGFFSFYSVRTWVGDSFYKQGQVGMNIGQPAYAEAMYQVAAGKLGPVSPDQLNNIHLPVIEPADKQLTIVPGLNPDQELYWVKMGIAFESAAAQATKQEDKLLYYRTALAIHHYTLEMNPINGYNFNNKGRVLKAMGEVFGDPHYLELALQHYDKAIELDQNNVYFNLDKTATLLDLGRNDQALDVCLQLTQKFPDFALPYSYAGFIKMRAKQVDDAIHYFTLAVQKDWKGDNASKALAATNLGMLLESKHKGPEALAAYHAAVEANPGLPEAGLHLSDLLVRANDKADAVAVLQNLLKASPKQPQAEAALQRLGVAP